MASLSDILSSLQNGVIAINNFGLQMKGTLYNILSRFNIITANVATNTANIATNTANIATNTANIATNTANIATNTADILNKETKNYIINGAMMVSQENGTTAGSVVGYYAVDMLQMTFAGTTGVYSAVQVASASPAGSPNRMRVTVTTADAAVAAGDTVLLQQNIEGLRVADLMFGVATAKLTTLQFGVKAPAGTYCIAFANAAANRTYVAEYTISAPEANTDVVKSVTIPGDTTGTWLKDTGVGLNVRWGLMAGSTWQQAAGSWGAVNAVGSANQFNFMGTLGNVFELFDVSLTIGATAPTFQLPDYPETLRACQRYWEKTYSYADAVGTVYGTVSGGNAIPSAYITAAANFVNIGWFYSVEKRASPTVTVYSPFTGTSTKMRDQNGAVDVAAAVHTLGNQKSVYFVVSNVAVAAGNFVWAHMTANARL